MILVADSGSTKTTWAMAGSVDKIITEGLNPHFTTDEVFLATCSAVRHHFQQRHPIIYFYGAGCGNASQRKRVRQLLENGFDSTDIYVETDMLGACRAVSSHKASLVGILGTGSNACYYNGTAIKCQPASTGYILGDKGSANHVGRILLNDYLTHRMPSKLRHLFQKRLHMSNTKLMDNVYHRPNANRFLASLAPFAVDHQEDDDYCNGVIWASLCDWRSDTLQYLLQHSYCHADTINIVGGFAKAIESTLRRFFNNDVLTVGTVMADPIEGLLAFHAE